MDRVQKIVFLLIAALILACQGKQELASNPPDLSEIPDQESWNATLVSTSQGKTTSKIHYGYMQRFSKKKLVKMTQGVEIELCDARGVRASQARADEAVLNEANNNVDLTGNVVVTSNNGFNLNTDKLTWNDRQGKFFSDEFVRVITAERDTLYGIGFESAVGLENWSIKKPYGVTQRKLNLKFDDNASKMEDENR
jgi:LPS export ABC transporter protein LptC